MKTIFKRKQALTAVLLLLCLTVAACGEAEVLPSVWDDAIYTEDTSLGEGSKTVEVLVTAGDRSVTLTVRTDAATLGDALVGLGLVEGDAGQFGMYVKRVNGILADYDADGAWWGFNRLLPDGTRELMMVGIDGAEIADGECYELVYSK